MNHLSKTRLQSALAAIVVGLSLPWTALAAEGLSKSLLLHENSGPQISFRVPPGARSVSLQGWLPKAKRWVQLSTRRAPQEGQTSMRVPRRWQQRSLRVVAAVPVDQSLRTPVDFQIVESGRALTFFASQAGARLYSVESEAADLAGWQRVCTVAVPADATVPLRVALPSTLPVGSRLRVMALSGPADGALLTPLSARLGRGPSAFGGSSALGGMLSSLRTASGGLAAPSLLDASGGGDSSPAEVSRADIWGVRGSRIYFFNQLRGLQVIDVADRGNPSVVGELALPAVGEDMHLLGGSSGEAASAALIFRGSSQPDEPEFTRVLRVGLAGDRPAEQSALEVPGYFVESRLAGTLLHVVTSAWEVEGDDWRQRTWLTSIDLSSDSSMVQTRQQVLDFGAAQVGATDRYLWLSGSDEGDWANHRLYAWPLRVDGSLGEMRSARLGGVLLDKFKVGDTPGGLAAVVQSWFSPEGQWRQVTAVETFADNDTVSLAALSRLELIRDESLFATRFDGSRLYAVTFRVIDPLWLVDLSDPSAPAVLSELEVPGWSSFIEPMGDILVAVGREDGRVQLSLFDVSDPSAPSLAQRVYLGSSYSWSEAEWDERSVCILRDQGLVLLPVTETDGAASANKVALVEFDAAQRTLRARGTIAHDFSPRRADLLDGTAIASVSNRELLLVDAADRDNPLVTAEIALASGCELVASKGGFVYQVESGRHGAPGDAGRAVLRVAPVSAPSQVQREIRLGSPVAAAAAVFGDRLCIVECEASHYFTWPGDVSGEAAGGSFLSVWSLAEESSPVLLARLALSGSSPDDADLLLLAGGKIAAVSRSAGWSLLPMPFFARPMAPAGDVMAGILPVLPWSAANRGSLAVDIIDLSAESPRTIGSWSLGGEDLLGFSRVHSAGDLLAFSFVRSLPGEEIFSVPMARFAAPAGWSFRAERHHFQILDLADPAAPAPWAPVEIPGELVGVAWLQRAGGLIFTKSGEAQDRVAALGFDGERAFLASEVELGSGAYAMSGRTLFVGYEGGVREWTFDENRASWQGGRGWTFRTGYGLDALQPMDGALLASGSGNIWALLENGDIVSATTAAPGDIGSAAQSADRFLVPAGDYGLISLPAP